MKIYCLSVFLDAPALAAVSEALDYVGLASHFREELISDQIGDSAPTLQGSISGLSLIFLPANDFHRHLDLEIGLTTEDRETWKTLTGELEASGAVSEIGEMEQQGTPYAVFGTPELHGPYFGIFTGEHSILESSDRIEFALPLPEFDFHTRMVQPLLDSVERTVLVCTLAENHTLPAVRAIQIRCPGAKERPEKTFSSCQIEVVAGRLKLEWKAKSA